MRTRLPHAGAHDRLPVAPPITSAAATAAGPRLRPIDGGRSGASGDAAGDRSGSEAAERPGGVRRVRLAPSLVRFGILARLSIAAALSILIWVMILEVTA